MLGDAPVRDSYTIIAAAASSTIVKAAYSCQPARSATSLHKAPDRTRSILYETVEAIDNPSDSTSPLRCRFSPPTMPARFVPRPYPWRAEGL